MAKIIKLYLTIYCLTSGTEEINYEVTGKDPNLTYGDYVSFQNSSGNWESHKLGQDVFFTIGEAEQKFNDEKIKTLKSLNQRISELEQLSFSVQTRSELYKPV